MTLPWQPASERSALHCSAMLTDRGRCWPVCPMTTHQSRLIYVQPPWLHAVISVCMIAVFIVVFIRLFYWIIVRMYNGINENVRTLTCWRSFWTVLFDSRNRILNSTSSYSVNGLLLAFTVRAFLSLLSKKSKNNKLSIFLQNGY